MARTRQPQAHLAPRARLMLPVMAPVGGGGRSTVAGLLACSLAAAGRVAVVDTAPRLVSPWHGWSAHPGQGLASIPPDRPVTAAQVQAAAAWCTAPGGHRWQVMTDHRAWSSAPLPLPADPAAWHQLVAIGGWQAAVVDTAHPVTADVIGARWATGRAGLTSQWAALPQSVPVLCAPATGPGAQALQTAVAAAEADGLPLQRMVLALVCVADAFPAPVKAAVTMLSSKVGAIVRIPHDPQIAAHGLRAPARLKPRTLRAGEELAAAVLSLAHRAWGDPLPPAAVPSPLPAPPLEGTPVHEAPAGRR